MIKHLGFTVYTGLTVCVCSLLLWVGCKIYDFNFMKASRETLFSNKLNKITLQHDKHCV